ISEKRSGATHDPRSAAAHDGPELKPLQSEAGYIDARPQSRQIDETSCDARPDHTLGSRAAFENKSAARLVYPIQRTTSYTADVGRGGPIGRGTVLASYRRNMGGLLRPMYCLPQGDFRSAETHRNPSGDQPQHKLAGVTTIVRQVIGKLDA